MSIAAIAVNEEEQEALEGQKQLEERLNQPSTRDLLLLLTHGRSFVSLQPQQWPSGLHIWLLQEFNHQMTTHDFFSIFCLNFPNLKQNAP